MVPNSFLLLVFQRYGFMCTQTILKTLLHVHHIKGCVLCNFLCLYCVNNQLTFKQILYENGVCKFRVINLVSSKLIK